MDISRLRKKIWQLDTERKKLQDSLLKAKGLFLGTYYKVYKQCGNPICKRCRREGLKHGPFKALSYTHEGKLKTVFVRKKDEVAVSQGTWRYRNYQKNLKRIRKINKEILEILKTVREKNTKRYH